MLCIVCRTASIGGGGGGHVCVFTCLSVCLSVCALVVHVQRPGHHLCMVKHKEYDQTCVAHMSRCKVMD